MLGSAILYVLARWFDWNLASYPPGTTWYFNPFARQLMFFFGAWCGIGGAAKIWFLIKSRAALVISVAWILFAFLIVMTWHSAYLESLVPIWMIKVIYPIDKTDLDMLKGRSKTIVMVAFDLLYLNGYDLRKLKLFERKALLKKIITETDIQFSESFEVDGREMYRHACSIGLEGVVSKVRDSKYASGRGNDWVMRTCAQRETLPIAGFALNRTSSTASMSADKRARNWSMPERSTTASTRHQRKI